MNGALRSVVIIEVLWGLNPAQTVVSSNSGSILPQCREPSIQIPWCLLGWVSSSLLWYTIASLWHAPAFSSFHSLYHIQTPKFRAVMTLESPLYLGSCSVLTMKYFVLSSRVCAIKGHVPGRAGHGMAEPRCFQAMVSECSLLLPFKL